MEALIERRNLLNQQYANNNAKYSKKIGILYNQKKSIYDKNIPLTDEDLKEINRINEQITKIQREEYEKYVPYKEELIRIEREIMKYTPPCIVGNRLCLKKDNKELLGSYSIYIKDTDELVGKIEYRGYHISNQIGDIGFTIKEKYRGNHYAYEALELLSDLLISNEIDSFWICSFENNYPSAKTLLKYGGERIKDTYKNVVFLNCKTRKYNYDNKEIEPSKGGK